MKNKTLVLKNKYLTLLAVWLSKQGLAGNDSRQRYRFIDLLRDRIKEIENERVKIVEKYATKDKDKKPVREIVIAERDGKPVQIEQYKFDRDNKKKFEEEFDGYLEEEFIVDILEGNKEKVKRVREIVLNTDYVFKGEEGEQHNKWCEALEQVDI